MANFRFWVVVIMLALTLALTGCKDSEMQVPPGCNPSDFGLPEKPPVAGASPRPAPSPSGAPASAQPKDVVIDPDSLRKFLFEGNTAVLLSLNYVHQAKEEVGIARGNLLPSLNLGILLQSAASPGFLLSSVEFLLPFLLPSRWFDYYQSKSLLEADKVALRLMKVNEYASAYSLYQTILNDIALLGVLESEASDLEAIADYIHKAYQLGLVSADDLNLINGRADLARLNWSKVVALVESERAAMRRVLGLGVDDRISWTPWEVPDSEWEERDLRFVTAHAKRVSLEVEQIRHLQQAAHYATWSKIFGFIDGASVQGVSGQGGVPSGDSPFSNLRIGTRMGIGFAYYPEIQLSQLNEAALKIQEDSIMLGITEVLERILTSTNNAKQRLLLALDAEDAYGKAYASKLSQYKLGLTDLTQVLQTRSLKRQASVEVLAARNQVTLSRISLHRSMLTEQFAVIEGCAAPSTGPEISPSPSPAPSRTRVSARLR